MGYYKQTKIAYGLLYFSFVSNEENHRLNQDSGVDKRQQATVIQQTNRIWRFQCWYFVGTPFDLVICISLQGNRDTSKIQIFDNIGVIINFFLNMFFL